MERPKEQEMLKNCYLTKVNIKSVILSKKVVREIIYESANLEDTKLLYRKSHSKHVSDDCDDVQIFISIVFLYY